MEELNYTIKATLLLIIIVLSFLAPFCFINFTRADHENDLLPLIQMNYTNPIKTDATDFNIGYPPYTFTVTSQAKTDFAFQSGWYPSVNTGFNGTMYAYEHTFDVEYKGSSASRNDANMGENSAYMQISYWSLSSACTLGIVQWRQVSGATVSCMPVNTWYSGSMKVLCNLNQTNPSGGYKTLFSNITLYDYGYVNQAAHKVSTCSAGYSRTDETFPDLMTYSAADYGGYLSMEVKNQAWYRPKNYLELYGLMNLTLSANLEPIAGGFVDKWVFTNWKYYSFNLRLTLPYENARLVDIGIRFSLDVESLGNVTAEFIVTNESQSTMSWAYSSDANPVDITRFGQPLLLQTGTETENSSLIYNVTFPIFFKKQCLDLWKDGIDVYGAANATNCMNITWTLLRQDFFCIYSRGGFSMNYAKTAADAYLMAGGTPFSFYATNGTSVYNEIWYRDVQHVKLLPDVSFLTGYETFELQYGLDYVLEGNSSWQSGWLAQIMPYTVSYTGIFAGNVWINMTVNFKNRNSWQTSTYVYMFYHGSVAGSGDPGHFKAWVDLWFSDTNASSTGAARVNAYEYPMHDNADLWLRWLTNNWGVKDDVSKEAQIEIALLDFAGYPISAGKIKMMRAWSNLTVEDANAGQQITIKNFEAWDLTHSRELPLTGIPAPVFDETKIPTVGQSGILGAIYSLFSGLGQWLSENMIFGGLNLWGNFVAFLDTIGSWFGAPHFFTDLFIWIGSGMGWLGSGMTYILTLIYDIFLLFGSLMTAFLSTMAQLIVSIVNTITFFTNIMSGAIGGAGNLWNQLGISSWITVALIFYPIYLIILWEDQGTDAVVAHLSMIFGILSWLFQFFYQLGTMLISLVHTLIESIPVVE